MSELTIYPEDRAITEATTQEPEAIRIALSEIGVVFERVDARVAIAEDADPSSILAAYDQLVQRECARRGYAVADVVRVVRGATDTGPMREKFRREHTHGEDEARLFVEGSGCFYLRVNGRVYRAVLEQGDYISVPAGTRHWFDMGPAPHFTAIRLFTRPEGWIADFTGDAIAERYPPYANP